MNLKYLSQVAKNKFGFKYPDLPFQRTDIKKLVR